MQVTYLGDVMYDCGDRLFVPPLEDECDIAS